MEPIGARFDRVIFTVETAAGAYQRVAWDEEDPSLQWARLRGAGAAARDLALGPSDRRRVHPPRGLPASPGSRARLRGGERRDTRGRMPLEGRTAVSFGSILKANAVVGGALGRSNVKTHPLPGRSCTRSSPPLDRAAFRQMESPRPSPVRSFPRCAKGRNSSSAFPGGNPPHWSSTLKDTRLAVTRVESETVPLLGVNLNAFWSRFSTAANRICRSPSTNTARSTDDDVK